jgi:hypothetical protein
MTGMVVSPLYIHPFLPSSCHMWFALVDSCWNISILVTLVMVWSFEFESDAGLQIRFRTFDTGFICASAIGYYISNPILDVDKKECVIFRLFVDVVEICSVLYVIIHYKYRHKYRHG